VRLVILDDYLGLSERLDLPARLPDIDVRVEHEHLAGERLLDALAGAAIIITMRERTAFSAELLSRLPDLALLVTTGMVNVAIDLEAAADNDVTVCGTSMTKSSNTAELTWGLILALARSLPLEIEATRAGGWQKSLGRDLSDLRLGVVGLGRIGSKVAAVGSAFDMDVVAWSPHLTTERGAALGVRAVSKEELLRTSDVLSLHLVLSEATRHIIGRREIELMKETAYLVNTSRSGLVDTAALRAALVDARIAGAALDVFETEPWPIDDVLRSAPNLLATPHLGYVTDRVMGHWYSDAIEDVQAWRDGAPVRVMAAPRGNGRRPTGHLRSS
jgi:phosphoglycerate dehydrogenase-like enzyme